jgi:hypothetical protein
MYRIGIDLGGTNIAVGIVNDKFEIVAQDSTPTLVGRPSEQIVKDIAMLCKRLCEKLGISESEVAQATTVLSDTLRAFLSGEYSDVPSVVFGPFEAPVYRVDHRYRMRLIVKCRLNRRAYALFSELLCKFGTLGKKTQVSVDFNPSGL